MINLKKLYNFLTLQERRKAYLLMAMIMIMAFFDVLGVASIATWTHTPPRDPTSTRVTLLSRPQTEEWKGWMQFAFIMYHYYRAWSAYNWIRVFVSSYVW